MNKVFFSCLFFGVLFLQENTSAAQTENALTNSERPSTFDDDCDWAIQHMEVRTAWEKMHTRGLQRPGENVTVVQLDTGVIPLKSILQTNQLSSGTSGIQFPSDKFTQAVLNFVQPQSEPWDNDPKAPSFGHGTSTASLMVGWMDNTGINGLQFRGIAPWMRLIPVKVTDSVLMVGHMPTGGTADIKNLAAGIRLATQIGADVISVSLGAVFDTDHLLQKAVSEALDSGAILIAAAGQTFPVNLIPLPARLDGVIAVSASSRDKKPWNEGFKGKHIAWAAPGDGICHIRARLLNTSWSRRQLTHPVIDVAGRRGESLSFTESLFTSSGTSYSTAYTAAAAALWLQYHSPEKLRRLYGRKNISAVFSAVARAHAMDTPLGWETKQHGAGILNIRKLIDAPLPCTPTGGVDFCDVKTSDFLSFTPR